MLGSRAIFGYETDTPRAHEPNQKEQFKVSRSHGASMLQATAVKQQKLADDPTNESLEQQSANA